MSRAAAQSELADLSQALAREFPDSDAGWHVVVQPVNEQFLGALRPVLFTPLGALGFVLLIACV